MRGLWTVRPRVSRTEGGPRSAASLRQTRTSAWQNTPPAILISVIGARGQDWPSRGGRRRRVLVRICHAEFERLPKRDDGSRSDLRVRLTGLFSQGGQSAQPVMTVLKMKSPIASQARHLFHSLITQVTA